MTPCELLNFTGKFAVVEISGEIYDVREYLLRSLYYL